MTITCHCTSQGCGEMGGRQLDPRTQKSHAYKDKAQLVEVANDAAEHAIEDQLETIRLHLASSTLADDVSSSPSTTVPGGRLWTYAPREFLPHTVNISATYSPSRRDLIHNLLSRLGEIESSVNALCQTVNSELQRLDAPFFVNSSSFPLHHLFLECHHLDADLEKVKSKIASVTTMKTSIKGQLDTISKKLHLSKLTWKEKREKLWSNRRIEHTGVKHSTDRFFESILVGVDPIHQLSIFLVVTCQVILGQSRRGCSFMFSMLQYLVQLCLMRNTEKLSPRDRLLLSDFPGDPRSAEKALRLDRQSIIFAICPKDSCHKSHKPTFNLGSPIPIYPKYCLGHYFGEPCKEELLCPKQIQGNTVFLPLKPFVYFNPKDWLGSQLSEPGLEAKMDAAWSQTTESKRSDTMRDIFDGEMLQNFKGPDGKHFGHEEDEGRYVFSLSIDFFNPLSNKQAGKTISVGIISLVCLNFPPDIRYKSEHMCLVGIIPGPRETPLMIINQYLTPLVDDFLDFWHPGVLFSRTDGYKHGRVVCCAIVCVVCDLPAARKTVGFGPVSHSHFCAICHCTRQSQGYGDIDCHLWRRRTKEEYLASAKTFHDAETKPEQDAAYASSGIQWSELLRLPYFDPTRFVVIDAMHNLFLGLISEHFQNILGIRLDKDKEVIGPAINVRFTDPRWDIQKEDKKNGEKLLTWLRKPLNAELNKEECKDHWLKKFSGLRLSALQLASDELGYRALPSDERKVKMRRVDYARGLLSWRLSQTEIDIDPNGHAASSTKCGHVLTKAEMDEIRGDIVNMLRPSWLTSVPSKFGSAGYGKLKADQWRVLGTTFLPVSLVRLWSVVEVGNLRSERCRQILDMTMSLLSAVAIACSRVTSKKHAELYSKNMHSYLSGLKGLFPKYSLHPNHHMALHLRDYLLLYGPVHSWWTFPFERLIGILQRISTNYKIGEYEETISRSFVRSAALKSLILKTGTPEVIQNCEPIFRKFIDPQVRSTLLADIMGFSDEVLDITDDEDLPPVGLKSISYLPDSLKECIAKHLGYLPTRASTLSLLTVAGITYSVASKHRGNSCVLLDFPSKTVFLPAQIEHFVQFIPNNDISGVNTMVAVRRFKRLNNHSDPFSTYPLLRTQIWSRELGALELHPVSAIQCHFACSTILWEGEQVMVMVSLSREF